MPSPPPRVAVFDPQHSHLGLESVAVDRVRSVLDTVGLVAAGVDCVVVEGTDGQQALAAISAVRSFDEQVPVVLTTDQPDGVLAADATRAGATEYVVRGRSDGPSLSARVARLTVPRALVALESGADSGPDSRSPGGGEVRYAVPETEESSAADASRFERDALERVLARIDDAFFALDEEWRFTYVNDRALALVDGQERDLLGVSIWEAFPDAVGTAFETQYRRAMDTQERVTFEAYSSPLSAWFEVSAYPSETGLSVAFSDVTDRKRAEDERREREAKFRQFTEHLTEVVWMSSVDIDEIHYVNPAYERIWGRSRESIYDDPLSFLDGIHPDDRDRVVETIPQRARGEYDEEFRVVRPDGTTRWVRDRAYPITDEEGTVTRVVGIAEDVTERKRLRSELETSFSRITDAFYSLDDRWRFTYLNPRAAELMGVDADEVVGECLWERFEWAIDPAFEAAFRHAMAQQAVTTFEHYVDQPLDAWFEINAYPSETGLSVYFRDVTQRREREETTTQLLETTPALFACENRYDVAAVVVEAATELFGYDAVSVRLHDEETDTLVLDAATQSCPELTGGAPPVVVGEGYAGRAFADGEPIVVDDLEPDALIARYGLRSAMYVPLADAGVLTVGSPQPGAFDEGDLQFVRLLTTSAAAALDAAARRESLLRYEQVLETVEGMVYALDEAARFTLVTEPFAARLGYEREDLLGEHVSLVVDDRDRERATDHVERLLADPVRERAPLEGTLHTADGDEFPVEVDISLLSSDDSFRGTVGAVRDITERKERERYLQVLNRVLRHNLRNDLTVVMGYADQLESAVDDPTLRRAAATLRETATDLADLSEDAKRLEQTLRRERVGRSSIPLSGLVARVLEDAPESWTDAAIEVDVPDDLVVRAGDRLSVVLSHLVDNAVEHARNGSPTVRVSARASGDAVTVAVDDDGPGIPDHEREVVTGERDITQLSHGSGLGLWLVYWTVDAYDGEITFERSPLGGTRVTISLERAPTLQE
ncbi:PAS domain S-box protein [Natronobiforma cellulositropha]|uniref:PAS domain S-box protein n=1 Tax=Natronobiforma cellulositropha TaxID=1679076 RepID=UPI0021D58E97|nr:PAS domain S-box protein [Natronobiforma cellulositropha]